MITTTGTRGLPRLVVAVALAGAANCAPALSVSSSAFIDWAKLSLDYQSGSGSFTGPRTEAWTEVYDTDGNQLAADTDSASDWVSVVDAVNDLGPLGTGSGTVGAAADDAALGANTAFDDAASGAGFDWAYGYVWRDGTLETSGAGLLIVTVPFALSVSVDSPGAYANADTYLSASRNDGDGGSFESFSSGASAYADFDSGPASTSLDGLLSIAIPFEDGDRFSFGAYSSVSLGGIASVPVPPALLLFAPALAALARRRRDDRGALCG